MAQSFLSNILRNGGIIRLLNAEGFIFLMFDRCHVQDDGVGHLDRTEFPNRRIRWLIRIFLLEKYNGAIFQPG